MKYLIWHCTASSIIELKHLPKLFPQLIRKAFRQTENKIENRILRSESTAKMTQVELKNCSEPRRQTING